MNADKTESLSAFIGVYRRPISFFPLWLAFAAVALAQSSPVSGGIEGIYRFLELAPGMYQLSITYPGLVRYQHAGIDVPLGSMVQRGYRTHRRTSGGEPQLSEFRFAGAGRGIQRATAGRRRVRKDPILARLRVLKPGTDGTFSIFLQRSPRAWRIDSACSLNATAWTEIAGFPS